MSVINTMLRDLAKKNSANTAMLDDLPEVKVVPDMKKPMSRWLLTLPLLALLSVLALRTSVRHGDTRAEPLQAAATISPPESPVMSSSVVSRQTAPTLVTDEKAATLPGNSESPVPQFNEAHPVANKPATVRTTPDSVNRKAARPSTPATVTSSTAVDVHVSELDVQLRAVDTENDPASALQLAGELFRRAPQRSDVRQRYADALLRVQRNDEALAVLRAAWPASGAGNDYLALLAYAEQLNGDAQAAAAHYRQLTQVQATRGQYWAGLALNLDTLQQYNAAQQAWRQAVRDADLPQALREYAQNRLANAPSDASAMETTAQVVSP